MTLNYISNKFHLYLFETAAVAQSARAIAPQAEGWVFESQLRQTSVIKSSDTVNARQ